MYMKYKLVCACKQHFNDATVELILTPYTILVYTSLIYKNAHFIDWSCFMYKILVRKVSSSSKLWNKYSGMKSIMFPSEISYILYTPYVKYLQPQLHN